MRALDPRLLRRTKAARPLLAADIALGLLTVTCVIAQATLLARVVAGAFAGEAAADLRVALAGLAAAFAVRGILAWGMDLAGRRAAASILSELRLAVIARRLTGTPDAGAGVASGELAATAVQGVDALEAHFARLLPQVVLAVVVPLAVVAWVATVDLESAAVLALTLPLIPVFMWLIGRAAADRSRERVDALHALSGQFLDVVRGLPTLRAFNRSEATGERLAATGERYRATTMETLRMAFVSGAVLELAATLGVALVAVTAGVRLVDGGLGLETGVTVLVLAPEVYLPLRRLGAEFHASADGLAVADRLFALLDAPTPAAAVPVRRPSPAGAVAPVVRFERVSFSYPARPAPVLEGFDLTLDPAETVALVGESGAGKSTVVALLLGLLAPTAGRVWASGADLAACDLDAWRRQVAWVPQRPTLLRATLADNIRLGAPDAPDAAVRRAAMRAGADAVAAALPEGYDTLLGDGGRPVSVGERRRIGLARALLRAAPLLVLDEPTADLDPASVAVVSRAIRRLSGTRTVLLIAHRPDLVGGADRIVRLEQGALVAERERVAA